jgi:hypothetical protein
MSDEPATPATPRETTTITEPTEVDVKMSGYLEKRGANNVAWKKRYLILRGTTLVYSVNPREDTEKGRIELGEMDFTIRLSAKNDDFQVVTAERTYFFRAKSRTERDVWIIKLKVFTRGKLRN